ncbi:5-oxoprolinase subunit PxpB [Microbulbifer sp. CnH-101-E]|uniref:5-oxoprolinase subunit PxpB n=1 Tax=unclassified Microbulbifer TaxID=2619833 RepID=UPI0040394F0C
MTSSKQRNHSTKLHFSVYPNGDSALDIRFNSEPSENLSRHIIGLKEYLLNKNPNNFIELIPAYQCLTLIFNPAISDSEMLSQKVQQSIQDFLKAHKNISRKPRTIRIPVCYESIFAPDISILSKHTGLSSKEIIKLHTAPSYLVHMLGFTPGFLYLGGLNPRLECPRKKNPRVRIPAGAVGIGGSQTGVYPQATPGGWQIIGQTPIQLFQPYSSHPFIADPLDIIKFYSINQAEFDDIHQSIM